MTVPQPIPPSIFQLATIEFPRVRSYGAERGFGIGCLAEVAGLVLSIVGTLYAYVLYQQHGALDPQIFSNPLLWILFLLAALLAIGVSAFTHFHRRNKQREIEKLVQTSHKFALYFRPFTFDLRSTAHVHTLDPGTSAPPQELVKVALEEALGETCWMYGLAFRSIGAVENQIGPAAVVMDDARWQEEALQLIEGASLIVLIPGASPGSIWEIEKIIGSPQLSRTVWVMPKREMTERSVRIQEQWIQVASSCAALGLSIPAYRDEGMLFAYVVDPEGNRHCDSREFSFDILAQVAAYACDHPMPGHLKTPA